MHGSTLRLRCHNRDTETVIAMIIIVLILVGTPLFGILALLPTTQLLISPSGMRTWQDYCSEYKEH